MLKARREVMRPGWHHDPTGRHRYREWNGRFWTEHVSDDGRASIDPVASRTLRRSRKTGRRLLPFGSGPTAVAPTPAERRRPSDDWRQFWGD